MSGIQSFDWTATMKEKIGGRLHRKSSHIAKRFSKSRMCRGKFSAGIVKEAGVNYSKRVIQAVG
jgi:hypothetical protein